MRKICRGALSIALIVGGAAQARAQIAADVGALPSRPVPLVTDSLITAPDVAQPDPARAAELQQWMDEFVKWETWAAEWSNRRQPGWLTGFRDRREKPTPPDWLAGECASTIFEAGPMAQACTLLTEWADDRVAAQARQARAATTTQQEAPTKTVWWEHIHLDVLWPATQWRGSTYGVVGTHVTTTVHGRLQVFIAPGAMFLNLPGRDGKRVWKVATNYGIGYRLFAFTFPGGRDALLHVNLAKAWVLSDTADLVSRRSLDFFGFSMTFPKMR
jgi:hypothetical protein